MREVGLVRGRCVVCGARLGRRGGRIAPAPTLTRGADAIAAHLERAMHASVQFCSSPGVTERSAIEITPSP